MQAVGGDAATGARVLVAVTGSDADDKVPAGLGVSAKRIESWRRSATYSAGATSTGIVRDERGRILLDELAGVQNAHLGTRLDEAAVERIDDVRVRDAGPVRRLPSASGG